jgi:hypothetical protein
VIVSHEENRDTPRVEELAEHFGQLEPKIVIEGRKGFI